MFCACACVRVRACVRVLSVTTSPKLLLLLLLSLLTLLLQCTFDYPRADYPACCLSVRNRKLLMINEDCGGDRDLASSARKLSLKQNSGYFVINRVRSANYALQRMT